MLDTRSYKLMSFDRYCKDSGVGKLFVNVLVTSFIKACVKTITKVAFFLLHDIFIKT